MAYGKQTNFEHNKNSKKISSGIYALKRKRDFVDLKTLISVYNAIIHYNYFTYCCEVWGVFGETQSMRLLKPLEL